MSSGTGTASGGSSQDSSPAEGCRQRKFPTLGRPRIQPPPPRVFRAQSFSTAAQPPTRLTAPPPTAGLGTTSFQQELHPSKFLTSTPLSAVRPAPATGGQADRQQARPAPGQDYPARTPARNPGTRWIGQKFKLREVDRTSVAGDGKDFRFEYRRVDRTSGIATYTRLGVQYRW